MYCGIDFGTSNSTVSVIAADGTVTMVPLEGTNTTIPSTIFFDLADQRIVYGRQAIQRFLDGYEGRFMRALKSILGTSLFSETTQLGRERVSFEDLLTGFITYLKDKAETHAGRTLDAVVMGRPVHFADHDPDTDAQAQAKLEQVARRAGFSQVRFQFEPVAAALAYESTLKQDELAFIADIGGGTSDFSVIHLHPPGNDPGNRRNSTDESGRILANTGVRVGGTDLDKRLSLAEVMPHLGMGTGVIDPFTRKPKADIPLSVFSDLATWHKIHFLYNPKFTATVADILATAVERERFARYARIIETQSGHALAGMVEDAKITLSDGQSNETAIPIGRLTGEPDLAVPASLSAFNQSIERETGAIQDAVSACLTASGIDRDTISSVFLTGGSTAVPAIRAALCKDFQSPAIVEGEKFNSVGLGLGIEAGRQFGPAASPGPDQGGSAKLTP